MALVTGCAARAQSATLLAFAAASLGDALPAAGKAFEQQSGVHVDFSFGSSGSLASQALSGATADLFISAGAQPMDRLQGANALAPATRSDLLTNRLVVVVRRDNPLAPDSLQALASGPVGRIAIADPSLAPAGAYAREALANAGLWDALLPRLVQAPDVRATLTYVETGNADAGIVYQTDAATSRAVRVAFTVPLEMHSPIVYPAAVLARSQHKKEAEAFLAFLRGERGREVFAGYGFQPAQ